MTDLISYWWIPALFITYEAGKRILTRVGRWLIVNLALRYGMDFLSREHGEAMPTLSETAKWIKQYGPDIAKNFKLAPEQVKQLDTLAYWMEAAGKFPFADRIVRAVAGRASGLGDELLKGVEGT